MDSSQVRDTVRDRWFEITEPAVRRGPLGITQDPDDPNTEAIDIDLDCVGYGTNKAAFRVRNQPWVLLCGNGKSNEENDFKKEVDTLARLAGLGVRVPAPAPPVIFRIRIYKNGFAGVVPAFVQEYLPREEYVEMPKSSSAEREGFARDHIVKGNRVPDTIDQTVQDLDNIERALRVEKGWGDFQVMYHQRSGRLYVFDPLDWDPNQAVYLRAVAQWKQDIAAARSAAGGGAAAAAPAVVLPAVVGAGGGRSRSPSPARTRVA